MNKEIIDLAEKIFTFLKLEQEERQKEVVLKKETLKNEIKEILKNYSNPSEEKTFLELLLEKL